MRVIPLHVAGEAWNQTVSLQSDRKRLQTQVVAEVRSPHDGWDPRAGVAVQTSRAVHFEAPALSIPTPSPTHDWVPLASALTTSSDSWLFVPVLLHAAQFLSDTAANAWNSHLCARDWWPGAVQALRRAAPVPAQQVGDTLGRCRATLLERFEREGASEMITNIAGLRSTTRSVAHGLVQRRWYGVAGTDGERTEGSRRLHPRARPGVATQHVQSTGRGRVLVRADKCESHGECWREVPLYSQYIQTRHRTRLSATWWLVSDRAENQRMKVDEACES